MKLICTIILIGVIWCKPEDTLEHINVYKTINRIKLTIFSKIVSVLTYLTYYDFG